MPFHENRLCLLQERGFVVAERYPDRALGGGQLVVLLPPALQARPHLEVAAGEGFQQAERLPGEGLALGAGRFLPGDDAPDGKGATRPRGTRQEGIDSIF